METTYSVPRVELFNKPLPRETRTYKPVGHKELADITLDSIHKAGFRLSKQEYSSTKAGNVANGRYTISDIADSEMQLEIGWQNSYDKSLSLKFAIGTRIFICENGCVSGDLGAFAKKHMGEIQQFTPAKILESIEKAADTFEIIQKQREIMKGIRATKQVQSELIGRMFIEQDLITSNQINIIKRELKTPTFDYGCEDSLWELYNHTTFAMKDLHPRLWMSNHIKVHDFFTEEYVSRIFG